MVWLFGAFGRLTVKFTRAALILVVTSVIIVIASLNVPVQQDASAKIFDDVIGHLRTIPEYFGQTHPAGKPVEVEFNGQRMFYATSRSLHRTGDILDFYESMYRYDPEDFVIHAFPESPEAQAEFEKNVRPRIDAGMMENTLRLEAKRWGVFGVLDNVRGGWDNAIAENFTSFIEGARAMIETGRVSEFGNPKAVIIFRDGPDKQATIIRTWLDDNFSLNAFMPDSAGDLPGEDFEDVPRYPGSERLVSFKVPNTGRFDAINVYRTQDRALGSLLYYRTELERFGWQTIEQIDTIMREKADRNTIHFSKEGKECWISLRERDEYTYHTILIRGSS